MGMTCETVQFFHDFEGAINLVNEYMNFYEIAYLSITFHEEFTYMNYKVVIGYRANEVKWE